MANSKSSKKRIKINKRNHEINSSYKSLVKTFTKNYLNALQQYQNDPNNQNYELVKNSLTRIYGYIDKAAKKNILKKNNAARKKSRLYAKFKIAQTAT
uniref:30S ribosomal protein S20 n=1 Tax=Microzonia abyssicola TaxID=217214 RepID=UPI002E79FA3E|nr:30S ribosomal protein S20 [Syringoderma abyssicola]WAM65004.1 30S ribosomal protein S20 [Syringoderma abyssicola]